MKSIYIRITSVFHELGLLDGCYYLFDKALSFVSASRIRIVRYHIVMQPVSVELLCPPRRGRKITVREIFIDDGLEDYFPVAKSVISERYAQGARCLIAEKNGVFVGYLWFIKSRYVEDEVKVVFELPNEKCVWDFDVYVEPAYRIGFVFMRLWDEFYSILRNEGVEYSYSRISAFNSSSRNSHKRLGAEILCYASFLKLGGLQLMFSGCRPFFCVSFPGSSSAMLRLPKVQPVFRRKSSDIN